ncbi:hypothetical protein KJ854_06005 [Patescibacteria group bacterium]|nr:hypothetical protein [Patescibacteria group bacterium]
MEEKVIIPITPEDFSALKKKIGINQSEFCSICDGSLETFSKRIFAPGIFYKCQNCGKEFKKTNYIDFQTNTDYFQLVETRGAC